MIQGIPWQNMTIEKAKTDLTDAVLALQNRSTGGTTVELDGKYTVNVSNAVRTQTRTDIANGSTRRVMRYVRFFIGACFFGLPQPTPFILSLTTPDALCALSYSFI